MHTQRLLVKGKETVFVMCYPSNLKRRINQYFKPKDKIYIVRAFKSLRLADLLKLVY